MGKIRHKKIQNKSKKEVEIIPDDDQVNRILFDFILVFIILVYE